MTNKDIIQELNDLGSGLATASQKNIFSVPDRYFEGLVHQILSRIKAEEMITAFESSLPKKSPYQIPTDYFDGLEERLMVHVRNHADYQTTNEELESISPLLNSLNKRPVYSVPQDYFENLKIAHDNKPVAKVVSIISRKWFRYAAAEVVAGVVILAGINIYNNRTNSSTANALIKFENDVKKIQDVNQTETLIDFMNAGLNEKELATNDKVSNIGDVQQLLVDVPADELKDFTDQSKDIEDVMMTN